MLLRILLIALLVLPSTAFAEEKAKEEVELGEVVVTATRTEKPVEEAPASVHVITAEDIRRENVQTLDQALENIPGVYVHRGKVFRANGHDYVSLRGIPGAPRSLLLIDGQPINDGYSQGPRWAMIPVEQVERIEVVKGPFSALWGGNAMGGIINVITKTPEKFEFNAKGTYGTYNTQIYRLSLGHKLWEKFSFLLGYERKTSDGFETDYVTKRAIRGRADIEATGFIPYKDREGRDVYLIGNRGKYETEAQGFSAKLSFWPHEAHKLSFTFLYNDSEYEYKERETYLRDKDGNPVFGIADARGQRVGIKGTDQYIILRPNDFISGPGGKEDYVYSLSYEGRITEKFTLKGQLGLFNESDSWYSSLHPGRVYGNFATFEGGRGKAVESPSGRWNANLHGELKYELLGSHLLTTGFEYRGAWVEIEEWEISDWRNRESKEKLVYDGEGKDRGYAVFIQDEWKLHPKLTVFLGLRYDSWKTFDGMSHDIAEEEKTGRPTLTRYPDRSDDELSPKLALVFKPFELTTLRASVARAFRPPTIYNLYRYSWGHGYPEWPNPDLKPEIIRIGWEAGLTQKTRFNTEFNLTYFQNYLDDLIYKVEEKRIIDGEEYKGKTFANAAKAEIFGVELEVNQKIGRHLNVFGNFTYYHKREIVENPYKPEIEGKKITHVPEYMAGGGIGLDFKRFNATLTGRYVAKLYARDDNLDTHTGVWGSYDPYFVVDLKTAFKPTKNVAFTFSIDNLFDREYFRYSRQPGRTFWGEIAVTF